MVTWIIAVLVGVITGILSGMGIGGGTLLVLYLTAILDTVQNTAAGINLLYFLGCAPSSLIWHIKEHRIVWRVALWAVAGGVTTALVTSLFVPHPTPDWLRRTFGGLLLIIGCRELWQVIHTEKNSG